MRRLLHLLLLLTVMTAPFARGNGAPASRMGITAGMGVSYLTQRDLVDMINGGYMPGKRVDEFNSAVDFFGSVFLPLSADWALRFEYAYVLNSYNISAPLGPGDFSAMLHMPSVLLEYILVEEGVYNLSGGVGGGYHIGKLDVKYGTLRDSYTATGPGMVMMLSGNTALGENLFVHLSVNARWEFLGELLNGSNQSPGRAAGGGPATLGSFGVGARLGASYFF
ncbi:MAG: hypothetical protein IT282_04655 [Bacteroidetes bacterium]|nr:hypothetical protein [Bacteroidota bacterium]